MSIYFVYTQHREGRETIAATYTSEEFAHPDQMAKAKAGALRLKGQRTRIVTNQGGDE